MVSLQAQLALKRACISNSEHTAENERGLELWRQVKITRTGCLHECENGPMTVIYPGGAWYARLTSEQVELIVREHLLQGRPVAHFLYHYLADGGSNAQGLYE